MTSTGLVHDYLLVMRGAERTFAALADCWNEAPIYTLLYDEGATDHRFAGHKVHTSPLQRTRARQRGFRRLLPLFPWAVGRLPVAEHDLVVSSSSAFAHGVRTRADAVHVCYCYTPFRYAWHERQRALAEAARVARPALNIALERVRRWDLQASKGVTDYIAISKLSQTRIAEAYGRESTIIHPPVDVDRFHVGEPQDYFLVVGELVAHKRVDVALEAARRARKRVKVVGSGPEYERLVTLYGDTAEFMRRLADDELANLYAGAQALIVANTEEFGIAAVEVQAAGRPVVCVDAGGVRETVVDGSTGIRVPGTSVEALADALASVDFATFDSNAIWKHAQQFSTSMFQARLRAHVQQVFDDHG
jgi:glycosyltransferase involved in cell wall biosynthesis